LYEVYRIGCLEKVARNNELIRAYLEALHDVLFSLPLERCGHSTVSLGQHRQNVFLFVCGLINEAFGIYI
jgi:hypothetical protein